MPMPGGNIMRMAASVIAQSPFTYLAYVSRATNSVGVYVTTYACPVNTKGSVQPVPRNLYQAYGLDFDKSYFNFYLQKGVLDVSRDISGDQFIFNGRRYQCVSKTDWFAIDGWDQVLCIAISGAEGAC